MVSYFFCLGQNFLNIDLVRCFVAIAIHIFEFDDSNHSIPASLDSEHLNDFRVHFDFAHLLFSRLQSALNSLAALIRLFLSPIHFSVGAPLLRNLFKLLAKVVPFGFCVECEAAIAIHRRDEIDFGGFADFLEENGFSHKHLAAFKHFFQGVSLVTDQHPHQILKLVLKVAHSLLKQMYLPDLFWF
jgi:hypothetical protein